jgi:arylsulfatase A-like enzyme
LGYGDLGVLFQNGRAAGLPRHATPNLDALAAEGLQLRRHYCPAPVCAPSRASLLLGQHQGHANVRDNQFDKALEDNHTVATVLKQAGYATACIGKWGLQGGGGNPSAWPAYPTKRGFDDYFGYVRHGDGHEHYPKEGLYRGAKEVWDNNSEISASLDKCYTADLWTARAKKWITDHHAAHPTQPFFMFLAYDTPHAVLELPTQPYPTGGGTNGGLQWLGAPGRMINTASGTIDSWTHPDYASATYDDDGNAGTPEVAWPDVYKRYASSVRRIDDAVGDLKQLLQQLGLDTNTLVVFTSDNGPSVESYLTQSIAANFFDSYGPHDGIKRDTWEGGIRMATLARWPGGIPAGRVDFTPSGSWDWLATFAELAGVAPPARTDGVSMVPTLTGSGAQRAGTLYVEYYEGGSTPTYTDFEPAHRGRKRGQMQVVQLGGYKGIRYNIASHTNNFEIYGTLADTKEATNLAPQSAFAALQQQMKDRVLQVRRPDSSAARPYDGEFVPASTNTALTNGVLDYAVYEGDWAWLPDFPALTAVSTGRVAGFDVNLPSRGTNFGILFTGYLEVPADGSYTFYLTSDAGAHLRIHDARVLDDDFGRTGAEVSASILLRAGRHPLRLSYRHTSGAKVLELKYSGPGIPKQAVPLAALLAPGAGGGVPFAGDDHATTPRNTPVNIAVLANDVDDGQPSPLSIVTVGAPQVGTALATNGQIRYTPNAGFLGEDSFTYTVTDGAATVTAHVTVSVAFTNGEYWFPFNQTSGLTTADAGGGVTAELIGFSDDTSPWVAGKWNKAIQFDGVDVYVSVTGFNGITGTVPRTLAAWVRTTNSGGNLPIIAWGPNTTGNKWTFLMNTAGQIRLEVTGGYIVGTRTVNDGQWHHVACTFTNDGSPNVTDVKLFVDGTPEAISTSQSTTINTSGTFPVKIGSDVQSRFWSGALDEVRIFPRALSAAEILALATSTNQSAAAWQWRYFGVATDLWQADDDGDGGPRLLEYALGAQPHITDRGAMSLVPEVTGGHLQVRFPRRLAGTSELTYAVQVSPDLRDWSSLTASEVGGEPSELPGFDEAIFQADPEVSAQSPLYLRLKVNLP